MISMPFFRDQSRRQSLIMPWWGIPSCLILDYNSCAARIGLITDPGHLPQRTGSLRVMTDSRDIMSLRGSCQSVCGYSHKPMGAKPCLTYRVATL